MSDQAMGSSFAEVGMIQSDIQLQAAQDRIRRFQNQLAHLRRTETDADNYRASASGFLAEIDRMQLEVRDYLSLPALHEESALTSTTR